MQYSQHKIILQNNFDFKADDKIDLEQLDNIVFNNDEIKRKIEDDFNKMKIEMTFKNIINFYNETLDLTNFPVNSDGIFQKVSTLLNKIEYKQPDIESNYLENVTTIMMLKYLSNRLEQTKESVLNKIQQFSEEILKEENKFFKYTELLKNNLLKISSNSLNDEILKDFCHETKARPETAHPSNPKNLAKIQSNSTNHFVGLSSRICPNLEGIFILTF